MLKIFALPLALCATMLSGCDTSPPAPKPTATTPKIDYLAAINKLAPQQRNATFYRAIEDAGLTCDSVLDSVAQDAVQGHPAWEVRCGRGQHWILVLLDDGIIQVLKAAPADKPGDKGAAGATAG